MPSMDENTGRQIDGVQEVFQSIKRILQTPLGSRVMRPEFGSRLYDLLDKPDTPATFLAIDAATLDAINRLEPRFLPRKVTSTIGIGTITIVLQGVYNNEEVELNGITVG